MKKYQLIGRKKVAVNKPRGGQYPFLHLCSLPLEILVRVLSLVELDSIIHIALTCSKLNNIVSKFFLYRDLRFESTAQFATFSQAHLPTKVSSLARRFVSSEPSGKINFITSVHFVKPPQSQSINDHASIAGSYSIDTSDSRNTEYRSFVKALRSLLTEAYGLKEVKISEISPQFEFYPEISSAWTSSSSRVRFNAPKRSRCLERLVLTAQSGWTIPFKTSHLLLFSSVFQTISVLQLNSFVMKDSLLSESQLVPLCIESLILSACIYADSKKCTKRKCVEIFAGTSSLELSEIQHGSDLSLIDLIKANEKLVRLTIDISSTMFYHVEPSDKAYKFNFAKFNSFFKLVCSGTGGYRSLQEIVLTNFDLFHTISHEHESNHLSTIAEEREECSNNPVGTFEEFLMFLSNIAYLSIVVKDAPQVMQTCKNCGFTMKEETKSVSTLRRDEWCIILEPVLANPKCSIVVYDHNMKTLFSRRIIN